MKVKKPVKAEKKKKPRSRADKIYIPGKKYNEPTPGKPEKFTKVVQEEIHLSSPGLKDKPKNIMLVNNIEVDMDDPKAQEHIDKIVEDTYQGSLEAAGNDIEKYMKAVIAKKAPAIDINSPEMIKYVDEMIEKQMAAEEKMIDDFLNSRQGKRETMEPKDFYQEMLKEPEWIATVSRIRERDNDVCRCCGDEAVHGNVHHMKYEGSYPSYPWSTRDLYLILLCEDCHLDKAHENGRKPMPVFEWINVMIRTNMENYLVQDDDPQWQNRCLGNVVRANSLFIRAKIDKNSPVELEEAEKAMDDITKRLIKLMGK